MNVELLVGRVLDDESLAGDLEEKAASALIAWAVRQAEQLAVRSGTTAKDALKQIDNVCRRARVVGKLVTILCQQNDTAAAAELARKEGLSWPVGDTSSEERAINWLLTREKGTA